MVDDDREIERKYLVVGDQWREQAGDGERIVQGYLHAGDDEQVRVRVRAGEAVLTVKRGGATLDRREVEVPLAEDAAEELLAEGVVGRVLRKRRHVVPLGEAGLTAEVDVFEDDLAGLVVAEVELPDTDTAVPDVPWLGEEVTGDDRYYNAVLATSDDPLGET